MADKENLPVGFMRLSAVYQMAQDDGFDYTRVSEAWFPEIGPLLECCAWSDFEDIVEARRLAVRTVVHVDHDDRRYTSVLTLWFDGKPFAIVQDAGREGNDARRRIVTDEAVLHIALAHVLEHLPVSDKNRKVFSPDYLIPVEEIFDFYSTGVAEKMGLKVADVRRDLFEFGGTGNEEHLCPILKPSEILIVALGNKPAHLLRSGDTYFSYVRTIQVEDLAKVTHLDEYIAAVGENAVKQGKTPTGHVYAEMASRPENFTEAVPL